MNRARLAELFREQARIAAAIAEELSGEPAPANESEAPITPTKRRARARRRGSATLPPEGVSDIDRARARAACRKFGIRLED